MTIKLINFLTKILHVFNPVSNTAYALIQVILLNHFLLKIKIKISKFGELHACSVIKKKTTIFFYCCTDFYLDHHNFIQQKYECQLMNDKHE